MARWKKSARGVKAFGGILTVLFLIVGISAIAGTLRTGSTSGADPTTGPMLTAPYDVSGPTGDGDNIIRLTNPAGCHTAQSDVACSSETDLCAMIYVFDDDQEMGECCGCPITPNELQEYSVETALADNFQQASPDN